MGRTGDCYDRYLVRMEEMNQSNRIIAQCVQWLKANPGPGHHRQPQGGAACQESMKANMEELIHHFKLFTEGFRVPEGEAYAAVEHPKGEFGIYMVSDGASKPTASRSVRRASRIWPPRRDGARPHDCRRRGR